MVEHETPDSAPHADPRLQLVERIVATPAFEKASRLQALLRFIVTEAIEGNPEQLSEANIGQQVFGKGPDYSPLTDSSVRVQARQLRLKLHEYFDGPGRDESLILEIPKGSYVPNFRSPALAPLEEPEPEPEPAPQLEKAAGHPWLPWILLSVACLVCAGLATEIYLAQVRPPRVPWPLSCVFDDHHSTRLILADSAYQLVATAAGSPSTLEQYLRTEPRNDTPIDPSDTYESRLTHALMGGTFTSFADAVATSAISEAVGRYKLAIDVESARDLEPRAFDGANFILIGSKSSNPWVGLYESKLNFVEADTPGHPNWKRFLNRNPQPHEAPYYEGSLSNDDIRESYADVAVVRGLGELGTVMIVQGLRHEGTEAAVRMLGSAELSSPLLHAFQKDHFSGRPHYFEALLETKSVAGIPQVTRIVAVRVYQP